MRGAQLWRIMSKLSLPLSTNAASHLDTPIFSGRQATNNSNVISTSRLRARWPGTKGVL